MFNATYRVKTWTYHCDKTAGWH